MAPKDNPPDEGRPQEGMTAKPRAVAKQHAQMITLSWEGLRTGEIACQLRCHPQTVRERFERFQTERIDGLTTNRPGAGRKARLTELERSKLIALVAQTPPGRPVRQTDGPLAAPTILANPPCGP